MKSNDRDRIEEIGSIIVDSAIQVHRALGPGLLESAHQACLTAELRRARLRVETEVDLPIDYRGSRIEVGYRIDMLVDGTVVIENKAIERLLPVHTAQLLTYLELSGLWLEFLVELECHVDEIRNSPICRRVPEWGQSVQETLRTVQEGGPGDLSESF